MTRLGRLALLLGAFAALGLLLAAPALAHAELIASTPADGARLQHPPRTVTLTFSEGVDLGGVGYLHVLDPQGRRVDAGRSYHPHGDAAEVANRLERRLGDGPFTVSFRVISDDGHPIAGTIRFVVGSGPLAHGSTDAGAAADDVTSDLFDVVRWVSFAGLAALGGLWIVLTVWPSGRAEGRARRVIWTGWTALVIGAVLELLLQGPYAAGAGPGKVVDGSLLTDTLHTDYGRLHLTRLGLLLLLAVLLRVSLRATARPARWEALAAVLGVAVVWTFSAGGHGSTTSPAWLSVSVDMAHLLAVATWLGGLLLLAVALFPRRRPDELRGVVPVFSSVAIAAVAALVASGAYSAWRGIGSVHAIFHTTYGWIVVGKVVLLGLILVVANVARRLVGGPTFAYAMTAATGSVDHAPLTEDEIATERLRRSVVVEAVLALVVLGFSAVLVAQPRGDEALLASYREPVIATASSGGSTVVITAAPGVHGPVAITVQFSNGRSPSSIRATAVHEHLSVPVRLGREGAGLYDADVSLPAAGQWRIRLVLVSHAGVRTTASAVVVLH